MQYDIFLNTTMRVKWKAPIWRSRIHEMILLLLYDPGWRGEDASRRQSSWFMTVGVVFCFDPAGHKTARQRCDSQQPRNIGHPSSPHTIQPPLELTTNFAKFHRARKRTLHYKQLGTMYPSFPQIANFSRKQAGNIFCLKITKLKLLVFICLLELRYVTSNL